VWGKETEVLWILEKHTYIVRRKVDKTDPELYVTQGL
jgi:hypothetical protein